MKNSASLSKSEKSSKQPETLQTDVKETSDSVTSGSEKTESNSKSLMDVFLAELKDIYGAEKQLIKGLPEIAKAAESPELKKCFEDHLAETKEQAKRIEKIFSLLGEDREAKKCKAMEGLLEEANEIIDEFEKGSVRDSALIIGSQKIEHYEIAAYGSLCELAEVLGKHKIAELLDQNLEEEELADKKLTRVSETVNDAALSMTEEVA